jgi:hypothetical protein
MNRISKFNNMNKATKAKSSSQTALVLFLNMLIVALLAKIVLAHWTVMGAKDC